MEDRIISGEESAPNWAGLVDGVLAGKADAMERMYQALRSLRFYFYRQLGPEADDVYHELVIDLFIQIRREKLREPERLPGYARVIAANKVASRVRSRISSRQTEISIHNCCPVAVENTNPEQAAINAENKAIAMRVLQSVSARDKEILTRFYLHGETPEAIQAAMKLSPTQFRLIKSRAKQRYTDLCQARLAFRPAQQSGPSNGNLLGQPLPA